MLRPSMREEDRCTAERVLLLSLPESPGIPGHEGVYAHREPSACSGPVCEPLSAGPGGNGGGEQMRKSCRTKAAIGDDDVGEGKSLLEISRKVAATIGRDFFYALAKHLA